ncbi:unnamed protein product [Lymnaea stagnalis]|uniref:BRICHOS domain-containing protein n=1 Tax=Lymnaea stagnalis TaxID=6523 RepID=A0AAV2I1D1_LYMST
MSPPKVSLSGKEPLKAVNDEVLPEKGDGLEFPSVINIETDRRVITLRQQRKQRRCRRIVCGAALVIIVAVAALATMLLVLHFRHNHRKSWECRRRGVPETVQVDHENQLIYAKHDHDKDSNTRALDVLHEYDRGLIAFRDNDNNMCYIDRLDETFEEGYQRWESYEASEHNETRALKVISGKIELEVMQRVCDIHIYSHCENAMSVWAMEIDIKEVTKEMKVILV